MFQLSNISATVRGRGYDSPRHKASPSPIRNSLEARLTTDHHDLDATMATLAPPPEKIGLGKDIPNHPVPGRTNSGGFKTSDGTLYVSKPVRDKKSKKLRALITFAPRKSHFDTTNEMSGTNEFRVSTLFGLLSRHVLRRIRGDLGIFYSFLDIHVPLHSPNLHHLFRNNRISTQFCICDYDLKRRYHFGHQRWSAGLDHWVVCAVRKGHKQGVDKLLLEWNGPSAYFADYHLVHSCYVDI